MLTQDDRREQGLGVAELGARQVARVERQREQGQSRRDQARRLVGRPGGDEALEGARHGRGRYPPGRARSAGCVPAWPTSLPRRGTDRPDRAQPDLRAAAARARSSASSCATRPRTCCARAGVVAVDPARLPYGAFGRLPAAIGDGLAARAAAPPRANAGAPRGTPRVVVIFHALQYQLARAVIAAGRRGLRAAGTGAGTATSAPTTRRRSCASASTCCTRAPPSAPR